MTRQMQVWLSAAFVALVGSSVHAQEGDPEAGAKVFNKCKACHVVDEEKNRVGPYLHGVFGRPAGTAEGFKYSSAMKDSGIVWDEDDDRGIYLRPEGLCSRQPDGLPRAEEAGGYRQSAGLSQGGLAIIG